jgi:hypothetical protein
MPAKLRARINELEMRLTVRVGAIGVAVVTAVAAITKLGQNGPGTRIAF